ncbi:hypothetical protein K490DRAFT_57026 [Saccharata proteae CBS 121410]|uniref:Uncharacterized protein n=1 Tax=Saccharata proteae CBS 121410 TaxID=1314787 RepID=A0A9P4LYT3_9PEZI|nr:hypothetical protein K490DRAFT_57026 [Saccharata proteae CBS 121410]
MARIGGYASRQCWWCWWGLGSGSSPRQSTLVGDLLHKIVMQVDVAERGLRCGRLKMQMQRQKQMQKQRQKQKQKQKLSFCWRARISWADLDFPMRDQSARCKLYS